ncbi:SPT3 Dosage dependent suppressor of Ty-induced promoter mutations-like protein [Coemansia sp. IMI 203386]|nr:SPT3 Dosage dependent suppressor of Ty-induced promoter mutations-like protein [Coemansia sp. IMI 203386]
MNPTNDDTAGTATGAAAAATTTAGPAGDVPASIHEYLATTAAALANEENANIISSGIIQPNISSGAPAMLPPDLSAFLMAAEAERSIPGSPSVLMGGLGFHSIQGSPILAPSLPQSPTNGFGGLDARHSFTNLAALAQHNQQRNYAQNAPFFGFDSTVNSAVQSATASPTTGALNRRGLLNSMANLNMTQLPPTAVTASTAYIGPQGTVDTIGTGFVDSPAPGGGIATTTITNTNTISSTVPSVSINGVPSGAAGPHPIHIASRQPYPSHAASAEFQKHVEETKAKGLNLSIEGIPKENAKSRVETQIKITLRLSTDSGERVTCWSHLALPEMLVSREKFRHRLQKHAPGESGMPASPQHVVHLEAGVICSSDPTRKVETCIGCIRREYKRSLRRKDARLRSAVQSACTTPAQSRAPSPVSGSPSGTKGMTGTMEADWDKARIAVEKQRIVIFNCNDLLDFSKGEVVLPTRITCYCRHHNEKVGFCICLTLRDSQGNVLKTLMSPPIMITDDHKSTKFKTDRKTKTKAEYERQGDGSAAYANHALSGLGSPHGAGSHLTESPSGHLGFRGGRQAMSARNSPTLLPYGHPRMLLDTYSQFASLAGTPSLGNTPIGSPLMAASHMGGGGFESSFHLPQAALGGGYHVSGPSLFSSLAVSPSSGHDAATAAAAAATAALVANYNNHGQQHHHHHHHQQQQMSGADGSSTTAQGMLPMSPLYGTMPTQHMPMSTLGLHPPLSAGVGPMFGGDSLSAAGLAPQAGPGADGTIRIAQMTPAQGPVVGGISMFISGRGFHPNIAVYFGTSQASRVQVLSAFNMACVLPPSKTSGPVAVRIRDLNTMTVYEGSGNVANLSSTTLQPGNQSVFTYVNDTDQAMLELALQIIGLLPNDKPYSSSGATGSPQVSPVMQNRSPSSSSRMSSPTAAQQNAKNKIIQDQSIMSILRALRTANDNHEMGEIEAHLLKLFSTVLGRGIIEPSRLNISHEATGRQLIHFASLLGMVSLATFLVNNSALLDETDNSGMTALHLACMYNESASVVELLLNSGASFRAKTNLGQTPFDIAQSVGHKKAQLLIEEREGYAKFIKEDHVADSAAGEAKAASAAMLQQSFAGMMPTGSVAVDAQGHAMASLFSHGGGGEAIFSDGSGMTSSGLFGSNLLFGSQQPQQQQQQNQHLHQSNPNMQPPYHHQHYQQ